VSAGDRGNDDASESEGTLVEHLNNNNNNKAKHEEQGQTGQSRKRTRPHDEIDETPVTKKTKDEEGK
jgi:hypothetical protein